MRYFASDSYTKIGVLTKCTTLHKKTYVIKGTDIHTNSIEGFWSIFKRGVSGVYTHISPKYLRAYADEYGFRYGNRLQGDGMFYEMLKQTALKKV